MTIDKVQPRAAKAPGRFWVLGAGRFGQIAVARLTARYPDARLTLVDRKPPGSPLGTVALVARDAIAWLTAMLDATAEVDTIVPAIPVHVAAGWIRACLQADFDISPVPIPDSWIESLPHAVQGAVGQLYLSHADFICPDDCAEPALRCTHTGRPRPMDLFRLLAQWAPDDVVPIVVRSHQLLPGVGGLLPADMIRARQQVRDNPGRTIMIATACRCHGVADFIRLEPKGAPAK